MSTAIKKSDMHSANALHHL